MAPSTAGAIMVHGTGRGGANSGEKHPQQPRVQDRAGLCRAAPVQQTEQATAEVSGICPFVHLSARRGARQSSQRLWSSV